MSIERMIELTQEIDALTIERYELGKTLPPVTLKDVKDDPVFTQSVREWMRVWMKEIDTSLLDRDDYDKWELLSALSEDDESEPPELYGFPFAWNTGWVLEEKYWVPELTAAGFLVYRYDGDAIIAGIDGGGYAFMDAHFMPLYAALAEKHGWMVETDHGPRRVTT